jgi:ATP-dependent Clp protease ATP-binding subunit ClpA
MIAQELEVSLHMAFVEARQQRHEFITVEHLLLALLDNPSAAEVLRACSANIDDLRKSLVNFIKDNTPQVAGSDDVDTQPTLGFQRVIQRAIMHVQSTGSGKKEVTGANVLVAIFGEKGFARRVLPASARCDPAGCCQLHCPRHQEERSTGVSQVQVRTGRDSKRRCRERVKSRLRWSSSPKT